MSISHRFKLAVARNLLITRGFNFTFFVKDRENREILSTQNLYPPKVLN